MAITDVDARYESMTLRMSSARTEDTTIDYTSENSVENTYYHYTQGERLLEYNMDAGVMHLTKHVQVEAGAANYDGTNDEYFDEWHLQDGETYLSLDARSMTYRSYPNAKGVHDRTDTLIKQLTHDVLGYVLFTELICDDSYKTFSNEDFAKRHLNRDLALVTYYIDGPTYTIVYEATKREMSTTRTTSIVVQITVTERGIAFLREQTDVELSERELYTSTDTITQHMQGRLVFEPVDLDKDDVDISQYTHVNG